MIRLNRGAFHDSRVSPTVAAGIRGGEAITLTGRGHSQWRDDGRRYELAQVQVFTIDADLFVRSAPSTYDVVILDFPDPRSVELAKLYSVEFYRGIVQHLAPGGVIAVQSTSPLRAKLVFSCIGQTLTAAGLRCLPFHDHVPSFGDWGWHLAWRGGPSVEEMRERLRQADPLPVPTDYVSPEVINSVFVFGKNTLTLDENVHINTKFRPVILAYYERGVK